MKTYAYHTRFLPLLMILACLVLPQVAFARTVSLTTVEWPPYTSKQLPKLGATSQVVDKVLSSLGLEFSPIFLPWRRTVMEARNHSDYIGYFPEYYDPNVEEDFLFSDPIGTSPLGLVERIDNPVEWETLEDLKSYSIGVVSGYVNTFEFDAMMQRGELVVDPANDDLTNLRKVLAGRLDTAVMDFYVFQYLKKASPEIAIKAQVLRFNPRVLESKKLFVCFRKTPLNRILLRQFNEVLSRIGWLGMQQQYIRAHLGDH